MRDETFYRICEVLYITGNPRRERKKLITDTIENSEVTMSELSEKSGVSKRNLRPKLKEMESKGYIKTYLVEGEKRIKASNYITIVEGFSKHRGEISYNLTGLL